MPIIVTLAYLFWKGAQINWLLGLWALAGMVLFHCAGNTWSDYFDFRKKVDADDTFGAKTLTTGMFKPEEIRNLAIGLLVVSVLCGLGLMAVTGTTLLWIGLAGVACTLLYPVLKFNALGDLDILLAFAFIPMLGTSYVVTGAIDWSVLWVALPVGLITDGILHSNNTRDMVTDRRAGITTMAMGMGLKASSWLFSFEMIFPYVWVAVLSMIGVMPVYTVAIFMTLPVAIGNARTMSKSVEAGVHLIADLDVKTANLQLFFSVLLTLSFVVAKFI
jgi:1,4-dihydroxy-2-naphthoate octaprenyltransferase